ncbi:lysine N(6)-hydroxylase/L-ornithine N(5)-oxygenase family protein [Dactylosporangium sp. CA-139114]|uniref:lysine N(6)-hydroxylase/L-ornithine N(5)-oxygenase family protein n=1 Tax=Dactylosporangium sp. CA-139114 TaxID=3239931 RepID=UPI003D999162
MTGPTGDDVLDVVAIGAGPANLSLAALASTVPRLRLAVLEAQPRLTWHEGMLPRRAYLQVSPLKDLVTLVDPTNPFSFLNFLARHGRLYRALISHRYRVTRQEFAQYYAWVCASLPAVRTGVRVEDVDHDGECFVVTAGGRRLRSRHLVAGVGREPSVPDAARELLGDDVFHTSAYSLADRVWTGRRVLLVGGGQSGAEVFLDLLDGAGPAAVTWVTTRTGLRPLDDSPFTNELFNPRYTEFFTRLGDAARAGLLRDHLLASDGVSEDLLGEIYARLYDNDYTAERPLRHAVLASTRLVGLRRYEGAYRATVRSELTGRHTEIDGDVVVLATGYCRRGPRLLRRLTGDEDLPVATADYSVPLDGIKPGKLFVQNAARSSHGLADSNLALVPWRSATILNAVLEQEHFATRPGDATGDPATGHLP